MSGSSRSLRAWPWMLWSLCLEPVYLEPVLGACAWSLGACVLGAVPGALGPVCLEPVLRALGACASSLCFEPWGLCA